MRIKYLLIIALVIWGCDSGSLYEESKDIRNRYWLADSILTYQFVVHEKPDPVDLSFTVRNTTAYPFYNLYVQYTLKDSTGVALDSGLTQVNLFEPKTGAPYGKGVGGIYSHTFPLISDIDLPCPGTYHLHLEQNMRLDSLPGIVSMGVIVASNEER